MKSVSLPKDAARVTALMVGALAILVSVGIDFTRYGSPGGFGFGQVLLALMGLGLVLIGALGKKVVRLYQNTATILLSSIILLALLELTAIVLTRLGAFRSFEVVNVYDYRSLPYYEAQDWSDTYWREAVASESYEYWPYIVWRHLPFRGETINVDESRHRETPGAECDGDALTVYAFGGSSMWGWGAPDWGTIAAQLQKELSRRLRQSVCVTNYGEDGFVSTQSLILLQRALQSGNIPDMVVFYDGVNDVYAAYQTGIPGAPTSLPAIRSTFNDPGLVRWLKGLRLYWLTTHVLRSANPAAMIAGAAVSDTRLDSLAEGIADTYLANHELVNALADDYGFEAFFFWQPHLAVHRKRLTEDEKAMLASMDATIVRLTEKTYKVVAARAPERPGVYDISDSFVGIDGLLWIDNWGHVTPEGNEIIARNMAARIVENAE